MRPNLSLLLGISATWALAACDSSSGGSGPVIPPTTVDYGGFLGAVNCAELDPLVPTFDGSGLTFTAEPVLPAGLLLNPSSGTISGTPAAPDGTTFHTITVANADGSASAGLTVGLTDPASPSGLMYPEQQLLASVGSSIGSLTPTLAAGGADSYAYSISPSLPAGLAFDPATGQISGTPAEGLPPQQFVVRAGDCVGNETLSLLWLEVEGGALPASNVANLTVVANSDGTVSIAKVDSATGRLMPLGYGPTGGALADVVVSPNQSTVYALLQEQNSIGAFSLDQAGAGLVALPAGPTSLPGASSVGDLLVSPDGQSVYATDPSGSAAYGFSVGSFGALDALPGSPYAINGSGFQNPQDAEFSGSGELLYTLNAGSNTVSALRLGAGGAIDAQVAQPTGAGPADLAALRLGNGREIVYVANATDATISVFEANPAAPSLTLLQTRSVPSGSFPEKLQVVRIGNNSFVYVLKTATQLISPMPINGSTGLLDPIQAGIGAQGVSDFGFAPDGSFGFLLSQSNNQLTPVSLAANGALSAIEADGAHVDGLLQRGGPLALDIVGSAQPLKVRTSMVFVANADAGTVSAYDVVGGGSQLASEGEILTGGRPVDSAVRPQGQRLFVVDNDGAAGDDLFDFFLNGTLQNFGNGTEIGAPLFASLGDARRAAVDPSGRFLLAIRGGSPGQVFSFQLDALGAVGQGSVESAGNDPTALVPDPSGRFVYVANRFGNNVSQHRIDAGNGSLSLVSAASVGDQPVDVALSPAGTRLYTLEAGNGGQIGAYLVNPNSGVLNFLGTSPDVSGSASALAVDGFGRHLVVADSGSNELRIFRVSTGENGTLPGVPTLLDAVSVEGGLSDVAFDIQGERVFATLADGGEVKTYRFSSGTLALTDTDAAGAGAAGIGLRRTVD